MAVNEYSITRIPSPMAHNQYLVSGTLPDPSAPSTPPTLRLSSCIRHSAGSGGLMRVSLTSEMGKGVGMRADGVDYV